MKKSKYDLGVYEESDGEGLVEKRVKPRPETWPRGTSAGDKCSDHRHVALHEKESDLASEIQRQGPLHVSEDP